MTPEHSPPDLPAADTMAAECLAVRVRLLNRTITGIYDDTLRPLGVTVGQLNILVAVAKLGPVAPGDVARQLNMEKSTVSRTVNRMREHGWITVMAGETARDHRLALDRKGRRLLEKALPLWQEAQKRTQTVLGERGTRSIHRVADSVRTQIARN